MSEKRLQKRDEISDEYKWKQRNLYSQRHFCLNFKCIRRRINPWSRIYLRKGSLCSFRFHRLRIAIAERTKNSNFIKVVEEEAEDFEKSLTRLLDAARELKEVLIKNIKWMYKKFIRWE